MMDTTWDTHAGMNISNDYDCNNSSFVGLGNATNQTIICPNDENVRSAWDILYIVVVSLILGLMTITTIVGKY